MVLQRIPITCVYSAQINSSYLVTIVGVPSTAACGAALPPIVAEQVDPTPFVVPRDLLIGKAFLVYFPALTPESVPNFGMLRFIH